MKFSDLTAKLALIRDKVTLSTQAVLNPGYAQAAINDAQKACINAHGKFYGLRSKYDGRGNLRKPLKG